MGRREELAKAWIATAVRSYQYRRIPTDTECTLSLAEVIELCQYWVKGRVRESGPRPRQQPLPRISLGSLHGSNTMGSAQQNSATTRQNPEEARNDILDRDLVEKTYVSIKRCPAAVATGLLHDPYTNAEIAFTRGEKTGAAVQIDHIVPLALAWDLGARLWTDDQRLRFANDPANLIAVAGAVNQDKGDQEPATWMPPNTAFRCQYAMQFIAVIRGYALPIDAPSAAALRDAAATCPTG